MSDTLSRISPSDKKAQEQLSALLRQEGITADANLDYSCGIFDEDCRLIATGSCFGPTLRCFAVDQAHRGEGLLNRILSHLTEYQLERGYSHLFVYTKSESAKFFRDLGFYEIAHAGNTLSFLENRKTGFSDYISRLKRTETAGRSAAIVMNANPFTRGHLHLAEQAAAENDTVHLFVLSEDASLFPFAVRWKLVTEGVKHLPNVICHESGPYLISSATFPSYFLKDKEAVISGHAHLDLSLFSMLAEALNITARYVGEEPFSQVTGLYNRIMAEELPKHGISCRIIPRLYAGGESVSASAVRRLLQENDCPEPEILKRLLPDSSVSYLCSPEAAPVLAAIRAAQNVTHY